MENLSLKDWAGKNGVSYPKAYRMYKKGEISNAYLEKGDIMVKNVSLAASNKNFRKMSDPVAIAASSTYRRNRAANSQITDNLVNIDNLFAPVFSTSTGETVNNSPLSGQDVITLSQKAYYGIPVVRRVINTLKEFSSSRIYLSGGNAKSRSFFENYFKTIKLQSFTDKFFLEFWRSSNCFVYKINGKIKNEDLTRWNKVYGSFSKAAVKIPLQYVILNPADIVFEGSAFFSSGKYKKTLNAYEIERLKNPQTPEDKQIFEALPDEIKKKLKGSRFGQTVYLELPENNVVAIFNNKADYESFGVSMIYPVLDDLEYKIELKQMDRAIAKTCQQSVLHVALGYENKNGEYFFSEEAKNKIEEIFAGEEVGKVLITDFTAKLNFILPQIGDLLDPKKYEVVDRDIHEGLMDILFGGGSGEKFSNLSAKIKVFVEKIRKAREEFLNEFLIPEMLLVAKELGFQSIPTPKFEDIDIEDNINFYKIVSRLGEVGLLTADEVFEAFNTGRFPTPEESEEHQSKYKEMRDKGLYAPVIGGSKGAESEGAGKGRPAGTVGIPQATKNVAPKTMGVNYDKLTDQMKKEIEFKDFISAAIKKENKIKQLTLDQISFVNSLANEIIVRENEVDWKSKVNDYLQNKINDTDQYNEIKKLSQSHSISLNTAASIYHSQNAKE